MLFDSALQLIAQHNSFFIENQDDAAGASWLSSISFGSLKIKLASTIAAIGAITLLEDLFDAGPLNITNVSIGLAIELVLLAVLLVFAVIDRLGKTHS